MEGQVCIGTVFNLTLDLEMFWFVCCILTEIGPVLMHIFHNFQNHIFRPDNEMIPVKTNQ